MNGTRTQQYRGPYGTQITCPKNFNFVRKSPQERERDRLTREIRVLREKDVNLSKGLKKYQRLLYQRHPHPKAIKKTPVNESNSTELTTGQIKNTCKFYRKKIEFNQKHMDQLYYQKIYQPARNGLNSNYQN